MDDPFLNINLGLASRYTSYVAVDPKEQKELKESWMMMKSRDIPVQVAHGWGGGIRNFGGPMMLMAQNYSAPMPMAQMCTDSYPMARCSMPSMMSKQGRMQKSMTSVAPPEMAFCRMNQQDATDSFEVETDSYDSSPLSTDCPANTNEDKLMKLVSSQNFDGSFRLESVFGQLLGTTEDDVRQGTYSLRPNLELTY